MTGEVTAATTYEYDLGGRYIEIPDATAENIHALVEEFFSLHRPLSYTVAFDLENGKQVLTIRNSQSSPGKFILTEKLTPTTPNNDNSQTTNTYYIDKRKIERAPNDSSWRRGRKSLSDKPQRVEISPEDYESVRLKITALTRNLLQSGLASPHGHQHYPQIKSLLPLTWNKASFLP